MKPTTCFAPAHILLPSEQVPLEQWGCVACDQFTSDRSYWQRAEATAAGAPSTLNLILPEATESYDCSDDRQVHCQSWHLQLSCLLVSLLDLSYLLSVE